LKRIKIAWSTEREVLFSLVIVLLLVILGGVVAFRQVSYYATTLQAIDHSRQIAGAAESVYRNLVSAESSQRNYLVSGDAAYLDIYNENIQNTQITRARLLALLDGDPTQVDGMELFVTHADEKLAELADTLEVRRNYGLEAAQALLETRASPILMTDIRAWLENLIRSETEQFVTVRNRIAQRVGITMVTVIVLVTLIVSLAFTVYTLVRRDIRAHRAFEARLSQSLRRERELSELKSHFVRTVSHEFRTPLAVIQTSADLLNLYGYRMTEAHRQEHMDKLQHQVVRLTALLEDALTVQKSQLDELPYAPAMHDLREICHKCIDTLKLDFADRDVSLITHGSRFEGCVDGRLLGQAISALLLNAVRFSANDAPVRVELACAPNLTTIAVIDHGVGIPADEHGLLFDLFFRGRNAADVPGTGLGLAVARSIIERHQGNIRVESAPGAGSTFTIELPFARSTALGTA
jgi:signal transduction histidine kinase